MGPAACTVARPQLRASFDDGGRLVAATYTAVIQRPGDWWIGWVEEVPGVNSQGATREELVENLQSALRDVLEMNRAEALAACEGDYEEVSIRG